MRTASVGEVVHYVADAGGPVDEPDCHRAIVAGCYPAPDEVCADLASVDTGRSLGEVTMYRLYGDGRHVWTDGSGGYAGGYWHFADECRHGTRRTPAARTVPDEVRIEYRGIVSIRYAHPVNLAQRGDGWVRPLNGYTTVIRDEATGKPITTVSRVEIHAPIDGCVTASLTMFADGEGAAILDGPPVFDDDGEVLTKVFEFLVHRLETT